MTETAELAYVVLQRGGGDVYHLAEAFPVRLHVNVVARGQLEYATKRDLLARVTLCGKVCKRQDRVTAFPPMTYRVCVRCQRRAAMEGESGA